MIHRIAASAILDTAYDWLCQRRLHYSANADIWDFRHHWQTRKPQLMADLLAGTYTFGPVMQYEFADDEMRRVWCAQDALVLKAMSMVLTEHLAPHISKRCVHLKGHGGAKQAVQALGGTKAHFEHVCRSDVKGYYGSIDRGIIYKQLCALIPDKITRRLLHQYLNHTLTRGGNYWTEARGISMGCPLSPLIGALALAPLDAAMEALDVFYVRYMDDWVILAKTRHKLRKAILVMYAVLEKLRFEIAPNKTFIGRVARGFDFLGYWLGPEGLDLAKQTVERHSEKLFRLYEQGASEKRIGQYERRWWQWVKAGLEEADFCERLRVEYKKQAVTECYNLLAYSP